MLNAAANEAKASFDDIYSKDDPRDYFGELGALDYLIPDVARPIFRQVADAWRRRSGHPGTVLDLGSSYGINSALFRFPVTFEMLRRRYARREMLSLASEQVRDYDRAYFQAWPRSQHERIIVSDISAPAVQYAVNVGLADDAIAHDFENKVPPADVQRRLRDVNLIFSTGAVGYISERTFSSILAAAKEPPWVVCFCLRLFSYEPIAKALEKAGLVTEKLEGAAFMQRRFRDTEEAESVLRTLRLRGLDSAGLESEGHLYAELFVSRPAAEVEARPLDQLVRVVSGRNLSLGPRLVEVRRDGVPGMALVRP